MRAVVGFVFKFGSNWTNFDVSTPFSKRPEEVSRLHVPESETGELRFRSWIPRHARIPGNELVDYWAANEAQRAERLCLSRARRGDSARPRKGVVSLAFLKTAAGKRANAERRKGIIERRRGNRSFRIPAEGEVPGIPKELRGTPKELAARFFQLASGHALIAPFIKEKFG